MNIVILTWRLTADPEMKYTADGASVANFLLAVQRMYKKDGDPKSDFIACAVLRAATAGEEEQRLLFTVAGGQAVT